MSYAQIGEAMGISYVAAHNLVKRALQTTRDRTPETINEVREQELRFLDEMTLKCLEVLELAQVPVVLKDGSIVKVDADPELRLKALDRISRLMERRAKLLGIDAPVRSETTVGGPWEKFLADVVNKGEESEQEQEPAVEGSDEG